MTPTSREQPTPSLAEEFERLLFRSDTSVRRLARLSGVSRRTLENWLYGRVERPRTADPLLRVARALHLPAADVDRLLTSAGHPTLEQLRRPGSGVSPSLLRDWEGQTSRGRTAHAAAPHRVPAAATPLIGRADELAALTALVYRPDPRLVTITGLGGAGKTRLAVETAHNLRGRFDRGIFFVPLDNIDSPAGFWEAIRAALRIPHDGHLSVQALVSDYLRDKQILLLLDNFEHLRPLAGSVYELLSGSRRLNLLLTSRDALDLQAEQRFAIAGLSTAGGFESPACRLFLDTARRRVPDYLPGPADQADIVLLCEQVEGLPLALELAGTWCDMLTPAQIAGLVRQDMSAVWHNAADRPQRHRSLWDLFDYSWRLLSVEAQEAALALSVLRGSFSPAMAAAVADCDTAVLKQLTRASILRRTTDARLTTHRLVRRYLAARAEQDGRGPAELETRFMEVVLAWTAETSSLLRRTFCVGYMQALKEEWQHVERAWWLAVKAGRTDLLLACRDLPVYFEARFDQGQGDALFEATRQRLVVTDAPVAAFLDEAQAFFATRMNDIPRGIQLARRALDTLDAAGLDSHSGAAGAYARQVLLTAEYAFKQMDYPEEKKAALRAISGGYLALFTQLTLILADAIQAFGRAEYDAATAGFRAALDVCPTDAYTIPTLRCFLGIGLRAQGEEAAAREQFGRALQESLEIENYAGVVTASYELRLLVGDDPDYGQCRQALEELALELGSRGTVGRIAVQNALQYLNMGLNGRARRLIRIGLGLLWPEADAAEKRRTMSTVAQAYIAFGLAKNAPQVLALLLPDTMQSA